MGINWNIEHLEIGDSGHFCQNLVGEVEAADDSIEWEPIHFYSHLGRKGYK